MMPANLINGLISILNQDIINGGEGSDVLYGQTMDDQLIHNSSIDTVDVFYGTKNDCLCVRTWLIGYIVFYF